MNGYFVASAAVILVLCVNHTISGELFVLRPLMRLEGFPAFPIGNDQMLMKRVVRFSWHLWSVPWVGLAVALVYYARVPLDGDAQFIVRVFIAICGASAGVVLTISRGKHFAWPCFAVLAALLWRGLAVGVTG